ncbi:site-specific DNA-methyltransferase [Brevundimonas sp.]|uniref:DNA-methyltransferase n=1 Tax=Brevundimonas sp. TaxID=1871086 RepID=UPI0025C27092|nr:site-specific DNA-methyltransferase [Brevundimonas sp.]MCG2662878.1 site-specific DNA-methyltransferase [Brevundimonas sp.]
MSGHVVCGDSREVLRELAADSLDGCACDPPYALVSIGKRFGANDAAPAKVGASGAYARASAGFMGQQWDTGETAFDPGFWAEVLRVLKPGAHIVAFGGTRTYHRLVCAIEDAGFEIRDQLAWIYGSGFPKSHNQRGPWEGWGSALKPAFEPIVLARKPLDGTLAQNLRRWGVGALHIDACRVGIGDGGGRDGEASASRRYGQRGSTDFAATSGPRGGDARGRWPANVLHDGSDEVVVAFPHSAGQLAGLSGDEPSDMTDQIYGKFAGRRASIPRGDAGSAARFFYCAKASKAERMGSGHPTVKPIAVMRWLLRLIARPGALILDPFAGSGTTGVAALAEGQRTFLIEREARFCADIDRRMRAAA